ncbi:hypothetical protein [Neptuniibacter pectenicola]|jgi:hypothetical protein|uniref:hypothetical protein n=1 Tax=Neptuniibacter pectenicola TaxID=1806669 RepID=UPI00082B7C97|nr:hypothetical protein [Neptuniibacter pectenicola]
MYLKLSKDLIVTLQSEAYGEASFRSAYYVSTGVKKRKAKALWQLEIQTKSRVLDYFEYNQLPIPDLKMAAIKGSFLGLIFPIFPWRLVMKIILKETEMFLDVFQRLEAQAPKQDKPFFKYLVDHEIAIRRFAELELENSPEQALQAVTCLLSHNEGDSE